MLGIDEKHLTKALLVTVFFLLVFSLIPLQLLRTGDFNFHFEKAGQRCVDTFEEQRCNSYYPLLHWIGGFFAFSPLAFYNFLMVLVVFITPIILFLRTRNWVSAWLYFSVTQYPYLVQTGGAYPQALAGIFLLLFLWTKNPWVRFPLLVVALLSHSQAFVLLLLVWVVQLFFDNKEIFSFAKGKLKGVFPACSAIFGKQAVDPIGAKLNLDVINKHGIQNINVQIKDLANFFVRIFPLPFLIMAFWQIKKDRDWSLIVLTVILFYYGIAVQQPRIFWIIPLLLLPSLTKFYSGLNGWWKKGFIAMTIVTFAINFGTWILFKANCIAWT